MTLLAQVAGVLSFICLMAIVVVLLASLIGIAAAGLRAGAVAARARDNGLRELAHGLGGEFHPASLFAYPELDFPHLGRTVTLRYVPGGEDESPRTLLTMAWNDRRLRLEIFPESPASGLRKLLGMKDIEVGSPDFDHQFVVTGNNEVAIKALLSPEARSSLTELLNLHAMNWQADLYVLISGGRLTITKGQYLDQVAALQRFVKLFLRFCEAAYVGERAKQSTSIEFVDPDPLPKSSEKEVPHCIVCGEPLTADLVTCRSCRTPHHKDCWQYFGGCATYACGGKQYVPRQGERGALAP